MGAFDKQRRMPAVALPSAESTHSRDATRLRPVAGWPAEVPHASATARELWLAIHLPQFMLESLSESAVVLRAQGKTPDLTETETPVNGAAKAAPQAIVDLESGGRVVCACDTAAAAAGVVPGMAVNSALALLPGLHTRERQPRRERELLEAVAEWGLGFTPRVSLDPPDAVLLELRASLRLFGGVRRLWRQLRQQLQAAGLEPRLALTPTPLASLWFARAGEEVAFGRRAELPRRLAGLPLQCTRWPVRSLQTLATMGVCRLGDCLRLPRDGFARRFDPQLLRMLDRASGRLPDPRPAYVTSRTFVTLRDFESEIADVARLERAISPLLDEFCAFLQENCSAVQAFELCLRHPEAQSTVVALRFVQPSSGREHIGSLLHERLAGLVLCEAVRSVSLRSLILVAAHESALDLFARDRRDSQGVLQLIERLRARLGTDAVHGLCLVPEHRPESACRVMEPTVAAGGTDGRAGGYDSENSPSRPLWLLDEPQSIGIEERPRYEGELRLEEGPERIESGWWDGHDIRRDYYVARNPAGVRLWIFRECRAPQGWFLHGVFG